MEKDIEKIKNVFSQRAIKYVFHFSVGAIGGSLLGNLIVYIVRNI